MGTTAENRHISVSHATVHFPQGFPLKIGSVLGKSGKMVTLYFTTVLFPSSFDLITLSVWFSWVWSCFVSEWFLSILICRAFYHIDNYCSNAKYAMLVERYISVSICVMYACIVNTDQLLLIWQIICLNFPLLFLVLMQLCYLRQCWIQPIHFKWIISSVS